MSRARPMYLGVAAPPSGGDMAALHVPVHHLVTHACVLGMTGSGKTGFLIVMVEEALRSGVPCILIDVKGDLPNLLLAFPDFEAAHFRPWVERHGGPDELPAAEAAAQLAHERREQLGAWQVSAAISLVLRLLGRDADPARSREHVLLSVLAERRLEQGHTAELGSLLGEVLEPPMDRIGALPTDDFLATRERKSLAAGLNTLLASPTFASWREGTSLDIREWLTPKDGRTPATIISVAHLDDEERTLVLGVLCWKSCWRTPARCPARAASRPCSSSTRCMACCRHTQRTRRRNARQSP